VLSIEDVTGWDLNLLWKPLLLLARLYDILYTIPTEKGKVDAASELQRTLALYENVVRLTPAQSQMNSKGCPLLF